MEDTNDFLKNLLLEKYFKVKKSDEHSEEETIDNSEETEDENRD